MNTMNHTRLTDSLERELLQQAIEAQYEYPVLDKMLSNLFRKVATFFRGPEVTIHQTHTAH
ncbi:hypothetical protein [Castellaniella sp. S9]|uniref:hypothetical protein n=1 Tax=Castellaniella sp. S9 TaxID=2993652 RepID=UPI0022B3D26F|nr:hypothetical protein [Castellaniella sp. S9]